jgi:CBS domain-containing protein
MRQPEGSVAEAPGLDQEVGGLVGLFVGHDIMRHTLPSVCKGRSIGNMVIAMMQM